MKKDLYNSNDQEYKHVIKLLKELPKEKAPDNFEYNLSVKIQNKDFALKTKESGFFIPWNVLVPVSGTVAAVLVLFFTFFMESESFENPFLIQPKLRNELNGNISKSQFSDSKLVNKNRISKNDVVISEQINVLENSREPQSKMPINEYNIAAEEKIASYPFIDSETTNLDEVLNKEQNQPNISRRANLVGSSNTNNFFKGFYIREEINIEEFDKLKAKNDSLVRALRGMKK